MTKPILDPCIDNLEKYNSDMHECTICMDHIEDGTLFDLQNIDNIVRQCNCKGLFHKQCFYTWYQQNSSCPICTLKIYLNNPQQDYIQEDYIQEDYIQQDYIQEDYNQTNNTCCKKLMYYADNNCCLKAIFILSYLWIGSAICVVILQLIVYLIYS